MGIIRGYGHSISSEYCTNNIDGLEADLRKMISSLRGWLHKSVNTILASYVSAHISCYQVPYVLNGIWKLLIL